MANIQSLNEQCMLQIFSYLPEADQMRVALVCKKWLEFVGKLIEFDELTVYHSKPAKTQIRSMFVRSNEAFTELLACPQFTGLKKLNLHINGQLFESPPINLSNFAQLEHLQIDYASSNQMMLQRLIDQQVQLRKLKLFNCYQLVDLHNVYKAFPNLTHLKVAYIVQVRPECISPPAGLSYPLIYFEQYHYSCVDRTFLDLLMSSCPSLEYLTLSLNNTSKLPRLVQRTANLKELNLNIPNEFLKSCFKYKPNIFKKIGKRDVIVRINGLVLRKSDTRTLHFQVDPDELFLITYEQLCRSNNLTDYSKEELEFYFNNFKEIEITEKAPVICRMLFHHDLILKRLKKMTFHFKNRNTANYLFDKFFEKMPNLEHLFIAEIENLTEEQVNKLPVLFPKLTNLEMHAYRPVEFPIEFIRDLPYLQTLVIRSNGFLQTSLHHIVKDLQYLTNLEIDPVYDKIIEHVEEKSDYYKDLLCHLHPFSSDQKDTPIQVNGVCRDRHAWFDALIFEDFNEHNYEF